MFRYIIKVNRVFKYIRVLFNKYLHKNVNSFSHYVFLSINCAVNMSSNQKRVSSHEGQQFRVNKLSVWNLSLNR